MCIRDRLFSWAVSLASSLLKSGTRGSAFFGSGSVFFLSLIHILLVDARLGHYGEILDLAPRLIVVKHARLGMAGTQGSDEQGDACEAHA